MNPKNETNPLWEKIFVGIAFWGGGALMYYAFTNHEVILMFVGAFFWVYVGSQLEKLK